MPPPAVSVLMPARDAGATIDASLRSVRRQRFTDWECVVVDDGSSDATAEIVGRHSGADARIRLIRTPTAGIVSALNEGILACRGGAVARMDADDVMHRDRLAAQFAALDADAGLTLVGCHVRLFPRRGLSGGRRAYEAWLNAIVSEADVRRDRFVECPLAHPTLMIRRSVLQTVGYRETAWAEDYDLLLRLLEQGARPGVVSRRLLFWRDTRERLSRTDPRYSLERFTACKAAFIARGFLNASPSFVLWGYGDTGKALARALGQHGRRPTCIVEVHPGRIGQRIDGVPVVGLDALPSLRGQPLVASVAGAQPRADIRAHLASLGFTEERDFIVAA